MLMYRFCEASPDLDGKKWVRNHAFENAIEKFWMQNSLKIVTSTASDCLARLGWDWVFCFSSECIGLDEHNFLFVLFCWTTLSVVFVSTTTWCDVIRCICQCIRMSENEKKEMLFNVHVGLCIHCINVISHKTSKSVYRITFQWI